MGRANHTKFRAANNTRFTQQLFLEKYMDLLPSRRTIDKPLYTLNDDVDGYINFRRAYVMDMDPTGYKTATRLLENFDHFTLLMKCPWFVKAKEEWDKEIAAKMEAEATDKLRAILMDDECKTTEQISAAKVLLGKAKTISKDATVSKRGRPSKEEVQGALAEEVRLTKEEQDDLARIRIVKK